MPLSQEQVRSLMAGRRKKGNYIVKTNELYNSDEVAVDVAEQWPLDFATKSPATLYQGFRTAAEKLNLSDELDIVNRDGHVFILVKSRTADYLAEDTDDDETEPVEPDAE